MDAFNHAYLQNFNVNTDTDLTNVNPFVEPVGERINLTLTERQSIIPNFFYRKSNTVEGIGNDVANRFGFFGDIPRAVIADNAAGALNFLGMVPDTAFMMQNNYNERGVRGAVDVLGHQTGSVVGGIGAGIVNDPVRGLIGLAGVKAPRTKGTANIARVYDDTSFLRVPEPHYLDNRGVQENNLNDRAFEMFPHGHNLKATISWNDFNDFPR